MQWRDNMKPASFKGVPFEIEQHSLSGGRRTISHEYPQRDIPFVEDMGMKQRAFNISAFVIGENYMAVRDRLIKALETKGSGVLVHPYLGTMTVTAEGYSMDETMSDGGMATFNIDFVQSEQVKYPENAINPATKINTAGQGAIAKSAVLADKTIKTSFMPSDVLTQLALISAEIAKRMLEEGMNINRSKVVPTVGISGRISEIDNYLKEANRIVNNAVAYAVKPASLVYQFTNILSRIPTIVDTPLSAVRTYVRLFDYVFNYFGLLSWIQTSSGAQQMKNAQSLRDSVLVSIVSSAALTATEIEFETNQQAYEVRNSLTAMIDSLLNMITDDGVYEQVFDLKSSTVIAIPPEGVRLQDVLYVQVNEPMPSLVFVNDQYGDIDNEEDFILRNKIQNPWIVPGGSIVEVLK